MLNRLINIFKKSGQSPSEGTDETVVAEISNSYSALYIKDWITDLIMMLKLCQGNEQKTIEIITKSGEDFTKKFNDSERRDIFWYLLGELTRASS